MRIPKKFKLFSRIIEVKEVDSIEGDKEKVIEAESFYAKRDLKILKLENFSTKIVRDEAFFHEIVHLILDSMDEKDLSTNEKFVNVFGNLICQVLNSMEYK